MLKKYLSDIAFMQVLNLLVKPIWILIIDAAVQDVGVAVEVPPAVRYAAHQVCDEAAVPFLP